METFQSVRSLVGSTKSASYLSSGFCTPVNSTTTAPPVGQHLIQLVRKKFNLASMSYAPYLVSFFVVLLSSAPSGCECYRFRTDHCVLDHRSSPHANVNYTYTPHVCFRPTVYSKLRSLKYQIGYKFCKWVRGHGFRSLYHGTLGKGSRLYRIWSCPYSPPQQGWPCEFDLMPILVSVEWVGLQTRHTWWQDFFWIWIKLCSTRFIYAPRQNIVCLTTILLV